MKLLSCLRTALCLLGLLAMPAAAAYPEKPINMIIAFTAGGSSDVQARIMQKYWNKYAPQPWVFVYKPGAGGIIGFTEIAKARPDGYTIGGLNVPHIILQPLAQNAQFTPDSFKYICQVVNDPQCIAVRKDSPYQSTSEIIAAARKNPGKIRVGLVGPLSGHHLMFLDYGKKYPDAKLTSVFYKGAADQNAALLGDHGAALVLPEEGLDGKKLFVAAAGILNDPQRMETMSQNMAALGIPDATKRIYDTVMTLLK